LASSDSQEGVVVRYLIAALVSLATTASIAADYTGYPPSEVKGEAR